MCLYMGVAVLACLEWRRREEGPMLTGVEGIFVRSPVKEVRVQAPALTCAEGLGVSLGCPFWPPELRCTMGHAHPESVHVTGSVYLAQGVLAPGGLAVGVLM